MGKTRKPRDQAQTKKPRGQTRTRKPRAQTRGNSEKKQPDERAGIVNAKPPITIKAITIKELQNHLPYAEEGELEGFLKQTERLNALDAYFAEYSEDLKNARPRMRKRDNAAKLLDYTRPYRIGLVSNAGAGKSSLVNAMLGKDLAIVDEGPALTGSVVEFYQDAASSEEEYVEVSFNNVSDIRRLVERGFKNADFDDVKLSKDTSDPSALVKAIEAAELPDGYGERSSQRFQAIKQVLTGLVNRFSEASIREESQRLGIDDKDSIKPFIEEPSQEEDLQGKSEIAAVKSVSYHSHRSDDSTVSLPPGVCLVDMPGIGGGSRHDFIFAEQLDELNAIIFVFNMAQRLPTKDSPEMKAIRHFKHLMGPARLRKNVFLVSNKIDQNEEPNNPRVEQGYRDITQEFYGKNPPERSNGESIFRVSAQGAIVGREGSRMSNNERASDDRYRTIALALRKAVKGSGASQEELPSPADVIEWSGVPLLITNLTEFASQQYVVGRSTEAKQLIDSIVADLQKRHQSEIDGLPQSSELKDGDIEGFLRIQSEKAEEKLATWAESAEPIENPDLSLEEISSAIHEATRTTLDLLLDKHLSEDRAMPGGNSRRVLMQLRLQADVQKIIWDEAIREFTKLADRLADEFETQFTQEEIQDKLIKLGFDRPEAKLKFSSKVMDKILQDMRVALRGFCERVAIPSLTDDEVVVTGQNFWEGFSNLLESSKTKEQISQSLQAFLAVAKNKYKAAIKEHSIPALLAVYKYEQFRVQDACRSLADELFQEYRRKFPEDENLRNVIVSAFQGEDRREKANQAKRTVLKTKLAKLAELAS